ncbi:MAG TPA: DUF1804 family protein [bacterium]|nr:DUF1804 family protein [bacterium]
MAKVKNKYAEYGTVCFDYYVKNEMTLEAISKKTGLHISTLSRWKIQYNWDAAREKLRGSTPELQNVIENEIKELLKRLKDAEPEEKAGLIDGLVKLNKARKDIKGQVDADSARMIVMGDFTKMICQDKDANFKTRVLEYIEQFLGGVK